LLPVSPVDDWGQRGCETYAKPVDQAPPHGRRGSALQLQAVCWIGAHRQRDVLPGRWPCTRQVDQMLAGKPQAVGVANPGARIHGTVAERTCAPKT